MRFSSVNAADRVRAELQKHGVVPEAFLEDPLGHGFSLTYARPERRRTVPIRPGPMGLFAERSRAALGAVMPFEEIHEPARALRISLSASAVNHWITEVDQEHQPPEVLLCMAEGGDIWAARLVQEALRIAVAGSLAMPPTHPRCMKCRGRARRHHHDCPRRALDTRRNRAIRRAEILDAIRRHQRRLAAHPAWFIAEARRACELLELPVDPHGRPW